MECQDAGPSCSEHAAVVLLDALGARGLSLTEARAWLGRIRDVAGKIRGLISDTCCKTARVTDSAGVEQPILRVFGDTILLLWVDERLPDAALYLASCVAQQLVVGLLHNGIPLRGAVSFGEVVWDSETALGPAIADAATYYERADWIGVVAAPGCDRILEDVVRAQGGPDWISQFFCRYEVPLKSTCGGHEQREMWTIPWPVEMTVKAIEGGTTPQELLDDVLSPMPREASHQPKYTRARQYLDYYLEHWGGHSMRIAEASERSNR